MPIIRVEMFKGRSRDQKRELVKEVTEAFVRTCGGTAKSLTVVITEVEKEDWGAAGELCCDLFPD
ncbi:4-oxalocrotonate tautomerase [Shimia gijangensis]|uniref:Tautomerase n=1 Tax=Shimia gijangensis TaxID=1470563 RepID=A0A1M6S702_9RHOB|nr:2-hydroxymuconate tautomerase [Shimia gijangensis]SHK40429.1 4-oxalocrotonate tautomerase [Shimia gijangensis]